MALSIATAYGLVMKRGDLVGAYPITRANVNFLVHIKTPRDTLAHPVSAFRLSAIFMDSHIQGKTFPLSLIFVSSSVVTRTHPGTSSSSLNGPQMVDPCLLDIA